MKKVLSLLLACAMIFSLALVGSAAGEGYTLTAAQVGTKKVGPSTKLNFDTTATTYNKYTHYTDASWNNSEEATAIALQISTATAASGGYIAIDYDETKVVPAAITYADGFVYGQTYSALKAGGVFGEFAWVQSAGTATITESTEATAIYNGNLVVTWTGAMSANQAIANVTFFLKSGVTINNFDSDTFKISADNTFLTKYKLRNGGASLDYKGTTYKSNDGTLSTSLTYPNSEPAGGDDKWEATSAPTGWTNPATEGATSVVVFGKNATAKTLADGDYKVKFGDNEYSGKASSGAVSYWAIVIYDASENGQYITAGNEYTGNVTCGTDTWNVKVTPVAGNSNVATKVAD